VGLTREQIAAFQWSSGPQVPTVRRFIDPAIEEALRLRAQIQGLSASDDDGRKRELLREADEALEKVRLVGDGVVACYFAGASDKERKRLRRERWETQAHSMATSRRECIPPAPLEGFRGGTARGSARDGRRGPAARGAVRSTGRSSFPEVFEKDVDGFAAFVGNPPFAGKNNNYVSGNRKGLRRLATSGCTHEGSHGASDLVAHFLSPRIRTPD
jgi:hypothetical protein